MALALVPVPVPTVVKNLRKRKKLALEYRRQSSDAWEKEDSPDSLGKTSIIKRQLSNKPTKSYDSFVLKLTRLTTEVFFNDLSIIIHCPKEISALHTIIIGCLVPLVTKKVQQDK